MTLRFTTLLLLALPLAACRKDVSATPAEGPTPAPVAEVPAEPTPPSDAPVEPVPVETPATEPDAVVADTGPAKSIDDPAADLTEPKDFALVKLELKVPGGKVYKDVQGKVIDWAVSTRIEFEFEQQQHAIVLKVERSGKSGAALKFDYALDGTEIVRGAAVDAKLKSREVLRVEGGTSIAFTIANKRVSPKPAAKRDTIATPVTKDPLAGAGKPK